MSSGLPLSLTWADVKPSRRPFDPAAAERIVRGAAPAGQVPGRPSGTYGDPAYDRWRADAARWSDEMTAALVERYGNWASGWRWTRGEGDLDGGPPTLYFLLLRAGVVLDFAAPLLTVPRRADDAAGALDFVRLIEVLIAATRDRAAG